MIRDEAEILFKFRLPCIFTGSHDSDMDSLIGKEFKLVQITDFYNSQMRRFETSVTLQMNERSVISTGLYNVKCVEQYAGFIHSQLKKEKKAKLKELLAPVYENLKTKKAVYAFIGKLIDEMKEKEKSSIVKNNQNVEKGDVLPSLK